jgi:hypothetical protein
VATLVDTNILLRSLNPDDPQYEAATNALAKLRVRNETPLARLTKMVSA